jgi:hypothetical protein
MSDTIPGTAQAVARAIEQMKEEADGLKGAAAALGPLAKEAVYHDFTKLDKAMQAAAPKIAALGAGGTRGQQVLDEVAAQRDARKKALRERLGPDLKAACAEAGIALRIVSREGPLRLRLPPFGVTVDREKGKASIEFAHITLEECAADAGEITAAHRRVEKSMGGFDGEAFFQACLRAWKAAVATGHGGSSSRVEVSAYMPYLALEMQGSKFRKAPEAASFVEYGRARFAFDVMRLREARQLAQDGWRMNLGVATGTTASSNAKSEVIWIETRDGEGEYKLNVFFTRQENASHG